MMGADAPIPPVAMVAAEVEERTAFFSRLIPAEFDAPKGAGAQVMPLYYLSASPHSPSVDR
jgi:hypothetical protein